MVRGVSILSLEPQILDRLTATNGNVGVVAAQLSVSQTYVQRIKSQKWEPPAPVDPTLPIAEQALALLPASAPPSVVTFIEALVPPNVTGVRDLRDAGINKLRTLIKEDLIPPKSLVALVKVLLDYEAGNREMLRPSLAVLSSPHNITFNTLIQKLGTLDPDTLRSLAGDVVTTEAIVIE